MNFYTSMLFDINSIPCYEALFVPKDGQYLCLVYISHALFLNLLPVAPMFEVNVSNGIFGEAAIFNELAGI